MKKKLIIKDEIFKNIIETMSEWVWIGDEEERTVYANPKFCEWMEYSLDEMIWRKSYEFWDPESVKTVQEANKLRKKWERSSYEWVLKSKTWKLIPVYLSWTPLPGWWTAGIMTDLREIKSIKEKDKKLKEQLEYTLKLKKELDRQILAINNSTIVIEVDSNWYITFINEFFESLSLYTKEELIWKHFDILQSNISFDEIKKEQLWRWEIQMKTKTGEPYWTKTTVSRFDNEFWKDTKYVFISADITQIKQLSQAKDEFINIASHELRTPMTAIKWYISMILDWDSGPISPMTRKFLEKVLSNVTSLIALVNDMLDIAKLESWKMSFEDKEIVITDILEDVYHDFELIMKEKNIDFKLDIDENLKWKKIFVDYNKIKQVLTNLVWNAYKFTPEWKSVTIKATLLKNEVLFEVIDTWIWIKKEQQKLVFEKFQQLDSSLQRSTSWTWLGLNICQKIIEHYGSKIMLDSAEWKGSNFFFRLKIM